MVQFTSKDDSYRCIDLYFPWFSLFLVSQVQNKLFFSKYSRRGKLLEELKTVDFTLRSGALPLNNTIEGITQGFFRQGTAEADYVIDPEVSIVLSKVYNTLVELTIM